MSGRGAPFGDDFIFLVLFFFELELYPKLFSPRVRVPSSKRFNPEILRKTSEVPFHEIKEVKDKETSTLTAWIWGAEGEGGQDGVWGSH